MVMFLISPRDLVFFEEIKKKKKMKKETILSKETIERLSEIPVELTFRNLTLIVNNWVNEMSESIVKYSISIYLHFKL